MDIELYDIVFGEKTIFRRHHHHLRRRHHRIRRRRHHHHRIRHNHIPLTMLAQFRCPHRHVCPHVSVQPPSGVRSASLSVQCFNNAGC